jgi:hypothetical protein
VGLVLIRKNGIVSKRMGKAIGLIGSHSTTKINGFIGDAPTQSDLGRKVSFNLPEDCLFLPLSMQFLSSHKKGDSLIRLRSRSLFSANVPASVYVLLDRNVASFGTIGFGDKGDLLVRRLPMQMEIR